MSNGVKKESNAKASGSTGKGKPFKAAAKTVTAKVSEKSGKREGRTVGRNGKPMGNGKSPVKGLAK